MKKTINLFVDMDGTVAKFYYKKDCLEKMYEQGYFENLPLYAIAKKIDAFAKLDTCVNVYILSACVNSPYCEQEKTEWLLKNMPNINPKNFIFTKVGESKAQKIALTVDSIENYINILLDDYTPNLENWISKSNNMVGVKFLNGINDTTKSWKGLKIKTFGQLEEIIQKLAMYGNN
jgi:5'(3')-deoxyribonucleotidase